jgi:zinc resistance-associated protein
MKSTSINLTIVAVALFVGLTITASTSFACRGNWMGHDADASTTLTVEQQQRLDVVKGKYSEQLDKLESSLNSKSVEYRNIRENDETTVGTLKRLESEMADFENQYWVLLDQANTEAGQYASSDHGPWFGCNYNGCTHQNHRWGSHDQRVRADHQHQHMNDYMAYCW